MLDSCEEGECDAIVCGLRGTRLQKTWSNYVANVGEHEGEALYETMENLTEMVCQRYEKDEIKVIMVGGIDKVKTRKVMEFVGRKGGIKWKIVADADETVRERGRVKRETLVIKTGGISYAEVLNKMRSQVNVEGLGIKVDNVKKNQRRRSRS